MASVASESLTLDRIAVSSMVAETLQEAIPEEPEEGTSLAAEGCKAPAAKQPHIPCTSQEDKSFPTAILSLNIPQLACQNLKAWQLKTCGFVGTDGEGRPANEAGTGPANAEIGRQDSLRATEDLKVSPATDQGTDNAEPSRPPAAAPEPAGQGSESPLQEGEESSRAASSTGTGSEHSLLPSQQIWDRRM